MSLSDLSGRLLSLCESGRFEPDAEGNPQWVQPHDELVVAALKRWKGSPTDAQIHIADAINGAPIPANGTGKRFRAEAEALIKELKSSSVPSKVALYRGHPKDPHGAGPLGWTTKRSVAERFAKQYGGKVWELPKGTKGLRIKDYIQTALDDLESEWIVWL